MSYTLPVPRFLYVIVTVKSIPGTLRIVKRFGTKKFDGFAGQYTNRFGNLRRDGVREVLSRAMAAGTFSYDEVWFGDMQIPPIEELATRFSDAGSKRVHPDSFSIRDWWIDSARRAVRKRR